MLGLQGWSLAVKETFAGSRRICLNMIVKNEAHVMPRLIESVKDVIDYYVIVDTGSTDGTIEQIPIEMNRYGIDGQVYQQEWVNFGVNRQQALELAMKHCNSQWALFIDADDELVVENATSFLESLMPNMSYELEKRSYGLRYPLHNLINIGVSNGWQWEGVVHEYLWNKAMPENHEFEVRQDAYIKVNIGEGGRSVNVTTEEKFLRDASVLEEDLVRNPYDPRSMYYLGQSYLDAGHHEKALEAFQKRVEMPGWDQETFFAQYQIGQTYVRMNADEGLIVSSYLKAYQMRPSRVEPLLALASYFHGKNDLVKGYIFASIGVKIPRPNDSLFVNVDAHLSTLLDELCTLAYYAGQMDDGRWACTTLLERAEELELSKDHVQRLENNLAFYPSVGTD